MVEIDKKYLDREMEIMEAVAKELKIPHLETTPKTHRLDGLLMTGPNGKIKHLIEAKSRNIKKDKYKTTKLEIGKWMALQEYNDYIPCIIAIGWEDCIGYAKISDIKGEEFSLMNRRHIRRPSDWQIAVEIPIDQFTIIKTTKLKKDFKPTPK
jgi:hypothetical protein